MMAGRREFFWCVAQLGGILEHQGLEAVQFDRCTSSNHNRMWWGFNCCMLCEGHCASLEREGAGSGDAARRKAHREANRAALVAVQKRVVVFSSLILAIS